MASRPNKHSKTLSPGSPFYYDQPPQIRPFELDGPSLPELMLWPDDCEEPKPFKRQNPQMLLWPEVDPD
jgi:hypothetical protein